MKYGSRVGGHFVQGHVDTTSVTKKIYFIVSKSHKGLAEAISKIFEKDKSVKVIYDRREGQNNNGYEFELKSINTLINWINCIHTHTIMH